MEWHQSSSTSTAMARPAEGEAAGERKARPQKEQVLNCPRCNSANTKFCYYNNYSLSQPRYFCKTCRRYWTEGGSLRNVPVGGGSRKNKRPSSSPAAAATSTSGISTIVPPGPKKLLLPGVSGDFIPSGSVPSISLSATRTAHKLMQDGVQGLKLGFPHLAVVPLPDLSATRSSGMGLLRPFMPLPPLPELYSSSAFGLMQELIRAPPLSFPTDATGGGIRAVSAGFGALEMDNSAITRRLLFPFEDVKPLVVHDPTNSTAAAAAASAAEFQMVSGRSSHAGVRRRFGATPLAMEVEPKKAGERNIHHINQSVELKIKSNQTNGFLISEREY